MAGEYTTKRIDELLDADQLKAVEYIVNDTRSGNKPTKALRNYLNTQAAVLKDRGVVADYLYYALCYKLKLPL